MRTRFAVAVTQIAVGNLSAQAILLVSSLVVARIYMPQEFGTFAAISAVVTVLGTVASWRLEAAIPAVKAITEAKDILYATVTVSLLTAGLSAAAIGLLGGLASQRLGVSQNNQELLWLIPVGVLFIGITNGLTQWAIREGQYSTLAVRHLLQVSVAATVQVVLGIYSMTALSLLIGMLAGLGAAIMLLTLRVHGIKALNILSTWKEVVRHRRYAVLLTPSTLMNGLGLQIPLIMGASIFGATYAGWFGMTQRVLAVPLAVLGASLGQVLLGQLSSNLRIGRVAEREFVKSSEYLFMAGILLAGLVYVTAPDAFEIVLGERYREAGVYARALAIGIPFQMLAGPLASLLPVLGYQGAQAGWDAFRLVAVTLVFVLGATQSYDAASTLFILALVNSVLYTALWLVTRSALRSNIRRRR